MLNTVLNTVKMAMEYAKLPSGYYFYLGGVILPVTPKSVQIAINGKNETTHLINEGEVNQIKMTGLTEISFECLLPNVKYPFAYYPDNRFRQAKFYLSKLNTLKQKRKPFVFKIFKIPPKDNQWYSGYYNKFDVTLENYEIEEDAQDLGFDVQVSIELKEYRSYGAQRLKKKKADTEKKKKETNKDTKPEKKTVVKVEKDTARNRKEVENYYIVQKGDCLNIIAKKKLDDSSRWKELYELNKSVIEEEAKKRGKGSSSNGWWIFPGTKLKLPRDS